MEIVNDFFNKLASDIRSTYFPNVKFYRDDKDCTDASYSIELFNNGCLSYNKLVSKLIKTCKDSKENIEAMVNKYVIK